MKRVKLPQMRGLLPKELGSSLTLLPIMLDWPQASLALCQCQGCPPCARRQGVKVIQNAGSRGGLALRTLGSGRWHLGGTEVPFPKTRPRGCPCFYTAPSLSPLHLRPVPMKVGGLWLSPASPLMTR